MQQWNRTSKESMKLSLKCWLIVNRTPDDGDSSNSEATQKQFCDGSDRPWEFDKLGEMQIVNNIVDLTPSWNAD